VKRSQAAISSGMQFVAPVATAFHATHAFAERLVHAWSRKQARELVLLARSRPASLVSATAQAVNDRLALQTAVNKCFGADAPIDSLVREVFLPSNALRILAALAGCHGRSSELHVLQATLTGSLSEHASLDTGGLPAGGGTGVSFETDAFDVEQSGGGSTDGTRILLKRLADEVELEVNRSCAFVGRTLVNAVITTSKASDTLYVVQSLEQSLEGSTEDENTERGTDQARPGFRRTMVEVNSLEDPISLRCSNNCKGMLLVSTCAPTVHGFAKDGSFVSTGMVVRMPNGEVVRSTGKDSARTKQVVSDRAKLIASNQFTDDFSKYLAHSALGGPEFDARTAPLVISGTDGILVSAASDATKAQRKISVATKARYTSMAQEDPAPDNVWLICRMVSLGPEMLHALWIAKKAVVAGGAALAHAQGLAAKGDTSTLVQALAGEGDLGHKLLVLGELRGPLAVSLIVSPPHEALRGAISSLLQIVCATCRTVRRLAQLLAVSPCCLLLQSGAPACPDGIEGFDEVFMSQAVKLHRQQLVTLFERDQL